jgi:hypothetical protein
MILAAGVAALAITAPAAAGPHGGHGGHNGQAAAQKQNGGHGKQAREARGGGQAKARVSARGGGKARVAARAQARAEVRHHGNRAQARAAERAQARAEVRQRAHDRDRARIRSAQELRARDRSQVRREMARRNEALGRNNAPLIAVRENQRVPLRVRERARLAENLGFGIGGCPPGLAKKPVACMPPGQAKKLVGARLADVRRVAALNELPVRLRSIYSPTRDYYYRYGDGYLYRVNRTNDVVSALLPLFGAGYTIGQPFPSAYPYYAMPAAYQPFYPATPYTDYRYANGYIYQVNPYTGMIEDVDPLLGYGYGYGQMMPLAYSAYNVPYQYRPYYYDTSDYYYRYAPGAIYQVDPTTSLITAVAALLSPNSLAIGQPLPVGYSAYNVPYAYRSTYYDTPYDWYRYSNGNIYRVDPATQLVTALVVSALT